MTNVIYSAPELELIRECLAGEVSEFSVTQQVVTVYNRRDAVITLAVLECLNYTAVECMTDWGFNKGVIEIIFN